MIVTLTLNPSLDRTVEVDHLRRGGVHRSSHVRLDAGGKGVNMARALTANSVNTCAVLPIGGTDGDVLARLLANAAIDYVAVPIGDAVRSNVSLVEPDGTVTKINTPGPHVTGTEVDDVVAATLAAAVSAQWVACSGSLPPGTPPGTYRRLIEALHAQGCAVALDTTGRPFDLALAARPEVVKPNVDELAAATARRVATWGDVLTAARELCGRGAQTVLASAGGDGALLVNGDGAWHGHAAADTVRSAVGAGDATLAGFLAAGGAGPSALCEGVAWGTAAVQLRGSTMPGRADIKRRAVHITDDIDLDRPLTAGATP